MESLYSTPSTKGGTFISTKFSNGYKFRLELDTNSGLHYHLGTGGRELREHHSIVKWMFGEIK